MRDALSFVALLLILIAVDLARWSALSERRLARSAVLAGIVVGRTMAGAA